MSKIVIDFFDGEAEIVDLTADGKSTLELVFPREIDGFVSINMIAARIKDGRCFIDGRLFDSGKYTPELIREGVRRPLPPIVKNSEGFFAAECTSEYVRKLSIRERALEKRVSELEEKMEKIYKSVYGELIF
ncbi:MAG: hypothetical protein J6Q85_03380 [Clostridia bacterium]|nr:hypothetical protein [Clostridia bacterium]